MSGTWNRIRDWREVWTITIAHGITHWYLTALAMLLPFIGKELNLSFTEIGLLVSVRSLTSSIANIPSGLLVDLYGRRLYWMMLALAWVGFPYLILASATSYGLIMLCLVLVGAGNQFWHPAAMPMLAQLYPKSRGMVLSMHALGANLGDAVAPLVIGLLLTMPTLNWRTITGFNVIPGIVTALVLWIISGKALQAAEAAQHQQARARAGERGPTLSTYWQAVKDLFRGGSFALLLTIQGLRAMVQNIVTVWLPQYMILGLSMSPAAAGTSLFGLQAAGMVAAPVAGGLSDRFGRKRVALLVSLLAAVCIVAVGVLDQGVIFAFVVTLVGFFLYAMRPVLQAWSLEMGTGASMGANVSLQFGAQTLFSSVTPILAGAIADRYGLFATFYLAGLILIIANLLLFRLPSSAPAPAD